MKIQRVTSKWRKTKVLNKNTTLQSYLPDTSPMDKEKLYQMLQQYHMVYIKPDKGTFGTGVFRIAQSLEEPPSFQFQLGLDVHSFHEFESMFDALLPLLKNKKYLIQQGIQLLTYEQRPFDFRIMVQKNPSRQWETTGIIGRLAQPKKIVTNYHSGGTPLAFEHLMQPYMNPEEQKNYLKTLHRLGVSIGQQLQTAYPRLQELGVDLAIDQDKRAWILEVNTKPDPFLFRKLQNRSVFRKIYQYAKAYGRFKQKHLAHRSSASRKI